MVKNRNRLCANVFVQRRKRHRSVIKDLLFPKSALRHAVPTTVLWILPQTQYGIPNAGVWKVPRGQSSLLSVALPAQLHHGVVDIHSYMHTCLSLSTGTGPVSCFWWRTFLLSFPRDDGGALVSFTRWFNFGDGSWQAAPHVPCPGFAWSWLQATLEGAPIPCRPEPGYACIGKAGLLGKVRQDGSFVKRSLESHRSPCKGICEKLSGGKQGCLLWEGHGCLWYSY